MVGIHPRWFKLGLLLCVAVAGLGGLLKVEKMNRRLQIEARLRDSPSVGAWLQQMRTTVEKNATLAPPSKTGGPTGPVAVWVGTVSDREHNNPESRRPELTGVRMSPAWLVAGTRGPKDDAGEKISMAVLPGMEFADGQPAKGEVWVFAVERIDGGHTRVFDGRRVR